MTNVRKLWILGALTLLAACDPYTKENTGPLEILSAFAVNGTSTDGAGAVFEATGTPPTFTITGITAGNSFIFVKTNKLLDGAAIQVDPLSCVPAAAVKLTVNGAANPAGWFTCYVPSTSTPSEGASVVVYQGKDINVTTGYMDSSDLVAGTYVIVLTITDKQGNTQTVTINATAV